MKKKNLAIFTIGMVFGICLAGAFGLSLLHTQPTEALEHQESRLPESMEASAAAQGQGIIGIEGLVGAAQSPYGEWNKESVYLGGDYVIYNNKVYKAKWWTQNEIPGNADVWEDTGEAAGESLNGSASENPGGLFAGLMEGVRQAAQSILSGGAASGTGGIAAPAENPATAGKASGFKVVGYYPSWKPSQTGKLQYDVLTHVVYAFAIPNGDGSLRPLENPDTARQIIKEAHSHGVKVMLAVGGWSYNDTPLEPTFVSATANSQKVKAFGDAIIKMCNDYGFDGIDMDWEHPRVDGGSAKQYEALMLYLAEKLHQEGKLLSSAVLSGATADGNIYYDAAAHSDKVLNAVDWVNVMAYDGGDGERHSSYEFAVNSGNYWHEKRKMPSEKVVLGVPFYGRPSWASYEDILKADKNADKKDQANYNGMEAHYNGISTIANKTKYAKGSLGGIMIWEVTQDTSEKDKSLLSQIGKSASQ